ncbi:MAG: DUF2341 domain-containing protein, partial [Deltaproteobacteria bacterium]|nr:DUF2341 domain-containing protein [Deltaproteobacteria bacterium]MBW2531808.1 DUF2341 domain-containing protein [Deltaproteobacteria bacterium]
GGTGGTATGVGGGTGGTTTTGVGGTGGGVTGWTRRRQLTVDLGGDGTVTDFPVLVALSAANVDYGALQSGGQDLRFTSEDGNTLLDHEIERFVPSGQSFVWVKLPQIAQSGSSGTRVWMYYGNPGAPDGQDAAAVWSPGFHGVWHLGQSLVDSSGNNGAATNHGTTVSAGRIGQARSFAEPQMQYVDTGTNQDLPVWTVEVWARGNHAPTTSGGINGPIMRQKNFQLCWDHTTLFFSGGISYRSGGGWDGVKYGTLSAGQWYYLAANYDGSVLRAYRDGVEVAQLPMGSPDAEADTAKIGRHAFEDQAGDYFDGLIDEVRISSLVRTGPWLRAQHRSMTRSGFVTHGPEETGSWALP